jgi:hypothetical protein
MSRGRPEDLQNTIDQIKNLNPVKGDLTWLRHKLRDQSGELDLLLLKGGTLEDIAKKLIKMELDTGKLGIDGMKQRALRHINHLLADNDNSSRDYGHNLSSVLKNSLGVWKFTQEESPVHLKNYEHSVKNEDSIGEIPIKEEIEMSYRRIAQVGKEIDENFLKGAIEMDFMSKGRRLKTDWWEITKINLEEWSKKG